MREDDLEAALIFLGRNKINKQEIKDMIWEVDENLDGCVDWDEFQLMFIRNINDTTGLEPSKFYNVVQFMIYDKKVTGMVSVDDTMKMLFERFVPYVHYQVPFDISLTVNYVPPSGMVGQRWK